MLMNKVPLKHSTQKNNWGICFASRFKGLARIGGIENEMVRVVNGSVE
jgi:hypothetical protein